MSKQMHTSSPHEKSDAPRLTSTFNKKAAKPLFAGRIAPEQAARLRLAGKRFVITSAQNNTEVNPGFLKALETYCEKNHAQLLVGKYTYNKGAYQKQEDGQPWYDPRIAKYALDQSAEITKKLRFCAELDINPTSSSPFSGLNNYCEGASGIVCSPQFAMKSLPGLGGDAARFLYTTGTCTQRNYKDNKAGERADEKHEYGALAVEVDRDGNFFVRQLAADDSGAFYDLTDKYLPNGKVLHDQRVEAVTLGDIHVEKGDALVDRVSFGKGGIMDTLKPKYLFIHDVLDFSARNHHNIQDPFFWAEQQKKGATVEGGIDLVGQWLKAHEAADRRNVVVESNHDEAYDRWMANADARFDPVNALFWHESCAERLRQIKEGNFHPNMLEWAVRRKTDLKHTQFLKENDSFVICKTKEQGSGIECALHGHNGPNGARGTPKEFAELPTKSNTGHTHTAGIIDGVYTAGVSGNLDMEYNKGPSSWSHSHIITYPNGKRAIVTVRDGKWHADQKVDFHMAAAKAHTAKKGPPKPPALAA